MRDPRNSIPLRLTMMDDTKFRRVSSFEHAELCRAFQLDPCTYHFDLPRTAYRPDLDRSGVSGFVLAGDRVVGTLHVALENERFRDVDPNDPRDRFSLKQTNRN